MIVFKLLVTPEEELRSIEDGPPVVSDIVTVGPTGTPFGENSS